MFSFIFVSGLMIAMTGVVIGGILLGTFFRTKKSIVTLLGALMSFSMSSWGMGAMSLGMNLTEYQAIIAGRVMHLGIILIPAFFMHFATLITNNSQKNTQIGVKGFYMLSFILECVDIFTPYFVQEVAYLFGEFYYNTNPTIYYILYIMSYGLSMSWGLYLLYMKGRELGGNPYKILMWGLGLSWFGGSLAFLPVIGIQLYPYGNLLIPIYPMAIAYAILSHHLFDARYAILQTLRIVFITFISLVVGGVLVEISMIFFQYQPRLHPVESLIGAIFIFCVFVLHRSRRISDFFLLASLAELERETEKFLDKKGVYKSGVELLSDLEAIFWNAMKIKRVEILSSDQTIRYPKCQNYFKSYRRPLVLSELEVEDVEGETHDLLVEVRKIGETIFSIDHGKREGSHFLVLGKKESEHTMTQEELKIINRIIPKIALALQVLDFNSSLQEEVRIQTKTLNAKNRELEVAYQKLQDLDQNKDNFLAIASHELRTPMTIIKGYSDLFLNNTFGSLSTEARSYMQKIFDNTESLIELVNNILDISKIEAGRFEILWEEVNIKDVIQKCVENFEILYRDKGITLILTDASEIDTITTDRSKFILVCNNILSNAYKFTEKEGTVEFKVFVEASCLFVKVTDTGKGIEKERLDHVFEKFNQMDNTNYTKKSIHGTGLGLHLCREIMHLLGGGIRVESTVGVGSTFIFFIPLHHDNPSTV